MIARPTPDGGLLVIHQRDHARLCGGLVDAWADDVHERARVRLAAEIHDDGWTPWDEAPRIDDAGRPITFRHVPPEPYVRIWQDGVDHALRADPYAGLLVSLHGTRFFRPEKHTAHRAFVEEQRHLQVLLLEKLGFGGAPDHLPPEVLHAHRLIAFLDGLSLFLCDHWEAPWTARVPFQAGAPETDVRVDRSRGIGDVTLDPYPFRHPVAVECPARHVLHRTFTSDGDLRRALDAARPTNLRWTLAPAQGV